MQVRSHPGLQPHRLRPRAGIGSQLASSVSTKPVFFLHEVNPIPYEGPGPLPSSALTKSSNRLVALYLFLGTVACSLLQIANLRVKGSMQGDGGHMNFKKLYYISCHTLENAETVKYGKARLTRDLIDLWVDSKISFGGLEFKSDEPALSQSAARLKFHHFCLPRILCHNKSNSWISFFSLIFSFRRRRMTSSATSTWILRTPWSFRSSSALVPSSRSTRTRPSNGTKLAAPLRKSH